VRYVIPAIRVLNVPEGVVGDRDIAAFWSFASMNNPPPSNVMPVIARSEFVDGIWPITKPARSVALVAHENRIPLALVRAVPFQGQGEPIVYVPAGKVTVPPLGQLLIAACTASCVVGRSLMDGHEEEGEWQRRITRPDGTGNERHKEPHPAQDPGAGFLRTQKSLEKTIVNLS